MSTITKHREPLCSYDSFLRAIEYDEVLNKIDHIHKHYAPKPLRLLEVKHDIKIKKSSQLTYSMLTYDRLMRPLIRQISILSLEDECLLS